ncbi:Protoglobin-domain-containing protein [Crucibulum laeve]|uniref:Protoglobin-domain-containing protein n=1 Tax=Crucibulum laeve TaxID=68775 RepID=A0A5C3M2M3_9AGAR|nr:Protoglobin-domain-containing protein [Crucibulum laeve]
MRHVPEKALETLESRVEYTRAFLDFTEADAAALHAAKPLLAPLIPTVVDQVYIKLLGFSITAQSFVPRQTGYTGLAPTKVEDLNLEHPQIKFRKDFLSGYIAKLVTMDYEKPETWEYLDKVGRMHTGVEDSGFKHRKNKPGLRVEYVHCAILLGFVEDIIVSTVIGHPELDTATKVAVVKAVNKILWLQNDLFARHYIKEQSTKSACHFATVSKFVHSAALPALALGALAVGLTFLRK